MPSSHADEDSTVSNGFNVIKNTSSNGEISDNNAETNKNSFGGGDDLLLMKNVVSSSPVFHKPSDTHVPVIQITESSLPSSTPTSPLQSSIEINAFQPVFKEEQSYYLRVPSSEDEDSDENEVISMEENSSVESRKKKFNPDEIISTSLVEQASKGVFMRSRSNTLHEIQEEESSDIDDYEYGCDSISDAGSYDVAFYHKQGYSKYFLFY